MSLVNKTNSQFSSDKLLHYGKPITGCGNLKGGSKNLSTSAYGYINGDNNRMFANSRPEVSSLSRPQECKLTGGRKKSKYNKKRKSRNKSLKKYNKTKKNKKRLLRKKRGKKTGKKLLKKWISQIKKFKRRTMKGGSNTSSHYVYQTPGNVNNSQGGRFANPISFTVNNSCKDNYNHFKQN